MVSISDCGFGWSHEVEATLASGINVNCEDIPIHTYPINKAARYVRFMAMTYYGNGATLQYFNVDYDYPNGIVNENYTCPSKFLFYCDLITLKLVVLYI